MIKRIRIQNFKCIRDQTVALDPVTVLVGRSGTGKSTFVQAIRFFRNLLVAGSRAVDLEGGKAVVARAGAADASTSIEIRFELPGNTGEYEYAVEFQWQGGNPQGLLAENLAYNGQEILRRVKDARGRWQWNTEPKVIPPVEATSPDPLLGQFPGIPQAVYPYTVLATGIGFYHLSSTVLGFGPSEKPMGDVQLPGLSADASNYLREFKNIVQNFQVPQIQQSLLATLQQLNDTVVSVDLDSLLVPQKLIIGHKIVDRVLRLPLQQESDGFRRFFAHLLALYQTPARFLNIFEEPENAIFPGALSLLADEFKAAPADNRGQIILTTHSPSLLDHFDVSSIRVVEMHNGETEIGPVSAAQQQAVRERLLTTGELLTVSRASIREPEPEAVGQ